MIGDFFDQYVDPQVLQEWLLQALLFLLSYVFIYLLVNGLERIWKQGFRWLFPLLNALFLTFFTIACSARFPLLLSTQASFFGYLHRFQSVLHQNQALDKFMGNNRLLLVDASHDLALVADQSMNATWHAKQLITDRSKLTRLLNTLTTDSVNVLVDMVVCDLTFYDAGDPATDSSLQTAFQNLNRTGKLLIAQSSLTEEQSTHRNPPIRADSLAGGSVDVIKYYDGLFFSHQLFAPLNGRYRFSLPYELYSRLERVHHGAIRANLLFGEGMVEVRANNSRVWVPNEFVPEFWLTDADVSRPSAPEPQNSSPDSVSQTAGAWQVSRARLRSSLYFVGQLANATDSYEQENFMEQLKANRNSGKRSIVFIGLFEDRERDIHQTLVGSMHGSILLLNVFLNLLVGSHHISYWYVLYLLAGFLLVSALLLVPEPETTIQFRRVQGKGLWKTFANMLVKDANELVKWLIDKRAYGVALLLLLGAITFFNHSINIAVVGIYLALIRRIIASLYRP